MQKYDVFGVGNALVDTVVLVKDDFLISNNISKGVMTLVDSPTQEKLLKNLSDYKKERKSGGSAANTMIALANCGGSGIYSGKVANDENGDFYKKDMEIAGIDFEVLPSKQGSTGTCLVLTTKDAERTMLTHLGISTFLDKSDIDLDKLKISKISYVEGYLWDGDSTKSASIEAIEHSKKNNIKVAYTYSDPFCVNRSRNEFIQITKEYVDYVFCNSEEAKSLSQIEDPLKAIEFIGKLGATVFMTAGANGAYIFDSGKIEHVSGFPVKAIDTVGAGDCFAAGVLFGLTHGFSLIHSCKWGNYLASRIVTQLGARLTESLKGKHKEIL